MACSCPIYRAVVAQFIGLLFMVEELFPQLMKLFILPREHGLDLQ